MPHYKDGTEAKLGDVVKGKGYNLKHEITGVVVAIKAGPTCNLTVATVARDEHTTVRIEAVIRDGKVEPIENHALRVEPTWEYGQADAFEKIA